MRTCLNLSRKKCWRVGHSFPFNHRPTAVLTVFSPQNSYDFAFRRFAFILFLSYILLLILPACICLCLSLSVCSLSLSLILLLSLSYYLTGVMLLLKICFLVKQYLTVPISSLPPLLNPFSSFAISLWPEILQLPQLIQKSATLYSIVYSTRNLPQSTLTWEYPR